MVVETKEAGNDPDAPAYESDTAADVDVKLADVAGNEADVASGNDAEAEAEAETAADVTAETVVEAVLNGVEATNEAEPLKAELVAGNEAEAGNEAGYEPLAAENEAGSDAEAEAEIAADVAGYEADAEMAAEVAGYDAEAEIAAG